MIYFILFISVLDSGSMTTLPALCLFQSGIYEEGRDIPYDIAVLISVTHCVSACGRGEQCQYLCV